MAEFPPNLDDGELWLPSDIFPRDEGSSKRFEPNNRPFFMDDLAHQFTTFTLLQHNHPTSILPPMFERLRPPVHSLPFAHSSHGYLTPNGGVDAGHNLTAYETGALPVGPRPFSQYHLLELAQTHEVESFLQLRARVLQNHQNRSHNRVLPIQGTGGRVGSFVSKSGGTGVFLPRTASTTTTTSNEMRKKQVVSNRREAQIIQPRNSMGRIAMGKHEDCHCQLSPEMALPQDWTY